MDRPRACWHFRVSFCWRATLFFPKQLVQLRVLYNVSKQVSGPPGPNLVAGDCRPPTVDPQTVDPQSSEWSTGSKSDEDFPHVFHFREMKQIRGNWSHNTGDVSFLESV